MVQELKKKDRQHREQIATLTKKLKNQKEKSDEESKISFELKKRHDVLQKKLELETKAK